MSSIFISHSSRNNKKAASVHAHLSKLGYRVFLDSDRKDGILPGVEWERKIYQELRSCQAVVALCSEHSMASRWCFAEIIQARALGKDLILAKIGKCEIPAFLQHTQTLDLRRTNDSAYNRLRSALQGIIDWDTDRSPYPGLAAFQYEDAGVFFGREGPINDVISVLNRLRQFGEPRVLSVLGSSGSGKSSLIRAGVLPKLRKRPAEWLVVDPFRPKTDPFRELAASLYTSLKCHGAPYSRDDIHKNLTLGTESERARRLEELLSDLKLTAGQRSATPLVVIDQAEELLNPDVPRAEPFLSMVWQLANGLEASGIGERQPGDEILFLYTLRSDFLGQFDRHPVARNLKSENFRLGPLNEDDWADVIERPARRAGLDCDPALAPAIIKDTGVAEALPLVAFTLRELYERYAKTSGKMSATDYREGLGGLSGSIARVAKGVLQAAEPSRAQLSELRSALVRMAKVNETGGYSKQAVLREEVQGSIEPLLKRFETARFLVPGTDSEGRAVLEVTHDAIFLSWTRLRRWLRQYRDFLVWRQRLRLDVERWQRADKEEGGLLRGAPLAEASHWLKLHERELDVQEIEFIKESLLADEELHKTGESRELAAHSLLQLERDQPRALVLALQAAELSLTPEAHRALRESVHLARCQAVLGGSQVRDVAWNPNGGGLVTGHGDGRVILWDDGPFEVERVLSDPELKGPLNLVAFDATGKRLAAANRRGQVRLWDTASWVEHTFSVFNGIVGLGFSGDSRRLVAAEGATAHVWDVETLEEVGKHNGAIINGAYLSADGSLVVGNFDDSYSVLVWKVGVAKPVFHASTGNPVWCSVLGSKWLVTGGRSGARLFDLENKSDYPRGRQVGPRHVAVHAITLVDDGFVTACDDGTMRVWKVQSGVLGGADTRLDIEEIGLLAGHTGTVKHVAWHSESRMLASAGEDGTVRLWRRVGGDFLSDGKWRPAGVLCGHGTRVVYSTFSPDGRRLVSLDKSGEVRIWDTSTEHECPVILGPAHFEMFGPPKRSIDCAALSPDGSRLATAGHGEAARLWESSSGRQVAMLGTVEKGEDTMFAPLPRETPWATSVLFAFRGEAVVTTHNDQTSRIWDAKTGSEICTLGPTDTPMRSMVVSPDKRHVAATHDDSTVSLWRVQDASLVARIGGNGEPALNPAFSDDGELLATFPDNEGPARIWEVETGEVAGGGEFALRREKGVRPDVSTRYDIRKDPKGDVYIRDTKNGADTVTLRGHHKQVTCIELSPDGDTVLTGSKDTTARLWNLCDGKLLAIYRGHTDAVRQVSYSADGRCFVTVGEDGLALVYYAKGADLLPIARARIPASLGPVAGT